MDGYELLQDPEGQDDRAPPGSRAVAVSAYASLDDRSRTLAAGFQGSHVAKPMNPAALVRALAAALSVSE